MKLNIEEARKELKEKDEDQIETETAIKWASRAAAAYEMCLEEEDRYIELFSWGDDLFHEALEHAALSKNMTLTADIKSELENRRKKCLEKHQTKTSTKALSRKVTRIVHAKDIDNLIGRAKVDLCTRR